jgi:hypothetical protein
LKTNAINFGRTLDRIESKIDILTSNEAKIMSTLSDLQAADTAIKNAVQAAITLIQSLHTGAGTVSDAEVEAVVADLNAAATALGGAMPSP